MDLANVTAGDFRALVGESFVLESVEGGPLTLQEVQINPGANCSGREPFALLFRSAHDGILAQGIYHLRHSSTGTLAIFLVPVSRESGQVFYEAVFN